MNQLKEHVLQLFGEMKKERQAVKESLALLLARTLVALGSLVKRL